MSGIFFTKEKPDQSIRNVALLRNIMYLLILVYFIPFTSSTSVYAQWSGWEDLGGTLTSAPTVCS
jgi:hypothetical protein